MVTGSLVNTLLCKECSHELLSEILVDLVSVGANHHTSRVLGDLLGSHQPDTPTLSATMKHYLPSFLRVLPHLAIDLKFLCL